MTTTPDTASVKIMVIDDSSTIRRSAEIFLGQAGYQVVLAEDGFDALAKMNDHKPALIFCDILMPRLDGYQTCALIKKSAKFHATPVIMLSSKDGLFDRARGAMVGSDAYLTKPFTSNSKCNSFVFFFEAEVLPWPSKRFSSLMIPRQSVIF
jgi:twitching motility two-component system response regulator PilG